MKTSTFLILALVGLHGCNTVEDPFLDGMTSAAETAQTGNRELPGHLARASLTGLGEAPLSVRQTMSNGGTRQDIVYANRTTVPGDNRLSVIAASASHRDGGQRGPSRNEIAMALQTDFPGIRMGIDPVIRRNSFGPYGAATGKLGNDGGCVYAWQALDKNAAIDLAKPITIRLRYCHPDIGPEILANLLGGLTLGSAGAQAGPALTSLQQATSTYAYSAPVSDTAPPQAAAFVSRIEPDEDQPVQATASDDEAPLSTATAIPMPE
jgi:hypothetical protein